MATLVLFEAEGDRIKTTSLSGITAAKRLQTEFQLLIIGHNVPEQLITSARQFGASRVLIAEHATLANPLADRYAAVAAHAFRVSSSSTVVGGTSTFTKDILPRVAALIDAPMLTDVVDFIEAGEGRQFVRPIYAGSALATVSVSGERLVFTCRGANFPPAATGGELSPVTTIEIPDSLIPLRSEFVSREQRSSERPDLAEARVVVSGGRPLRNKETFDKLIGGLADALGGAAGATRAAVDAGIAPNEWQIGQTGRVVRPDLYIAAGISGSVQHTAGIQESRVIVAINKDPDAPIFDIATYGLVGDLYEILPSLIRAARKHSDGG